MYIIYTYIYINTLYDYISMNVHTYVCGTMLTYIPMSGVKSHLKPTSDVRECSANNSMYYVTMTLRDPLF